MMKFGLVLKFLEKNRNFRKIYRFLDEKKILEWPQNLTKLLFIKYLNAEDGVTDLEDSFATLFLVLACLVLEISAVEISDSTKNVNFRKKIPNFDTSSL